MEICPIKKGHQPFLVDGRKVALKNVNRAIKLVEGELRCS